MLPIAETAYESLWQKIRINRCSSMQKAVLDNANLQNACFAKADLKWVHFNKAKASRASFQQAKLQSALFKRADLRGAYFEQADLNNAIFTDAVFDRKSLNSIVKAFNWRKAHFDDGIQEQLERIEKEIIASHHAKRQRRGKLPPAFAPPTRIGLCSRRRLSDQANSQIFIVASESGH